MTSRVERLERRKRFVPRIFCSVFRVCLPSRRLPSLSRRTYFTHLSLRLLQPCNLPSAMNKMKNVKGPRSRPSGMDRGGIRKRGPTRIDRDGDMDMDSAGGRNRGSKRGRGGEPGRSTAPGRAPVDAIQKAISGSTTESQANIRQGGKGGGSKLEQASVRGWKQSKAASNRDGGLESLITFLEKKLNTPDSKASSRARITKVCVQITSVLAVTDMNSRLRLPPMCSRFQGWQAPKRRSTFPGLSRVHCSLG